MDLILAESPRYFFPVLILTFSIVLVNHLHFHAAASLPAGQYLLLCSSYSLTFAEMNSEDERLAQ